MANPEKQQIQIFGSGVIRGIGISPLVFGGRALREITRYQIYSAEPTEILIVQNEKRDLISREELINARSLFGENRKKFLDVLAVRMQKGNRIIITTAINKAKKMPSFTPKRKDSNPNQHSAFRKFIEGNPHFTQLDKWRR